MGYKLFFHFGPDLYVNGHKALSVHRISLIPGRLNSQPVYIIQPARRPRLPGRNYNQSMSDRERLHHLIDDLPDFRLSSALALLEPLSVQEEEVDVETQALLAAARAEMAEPHSAAEFLHKDRL